MDHVERPLSPLNDMHIDSLPDVPVHSSPFLPVDDVPLIDILRSPSNSVGSIVPETPPFSSPACSPIQKLLSPSDSVGSVVPETPPFSSPDSLPVQNDPFSSPASPVQNDPVPQWRETWFRPPLAPRSPNDFPSFDVEAPESPLPSSPGSFVSQPDSPSPATALHSGPIVQPIIPSLRELTAAERDLARGEEMICRALRQMTLEEPGRDIRHHLSPPLETLSPLRAMTKLLAPFEPQRKEKRKESYNT
ncbi:hypothetical protein BDZ89DRAFT_1074755 [Hymenopellis radicata]|nr:hypothetical protein BDZ89DRAFT_1074755 [Hymenopellis radicata]